MTTTSRPLSTARTVSFKSAAEMVAVLGPQDAYLSLIEDYFESISVHPKGLDLLITGPSESVNTAAKLLNELRVLASHDTQITVQVIHRLMGMLTDELKDPARSLSASILSTRGTTIRPKTINQKKYVDAIDANTVIFGIGPAGTGKTYLAMAKAVQALQSREVNRIILTRPAVEAGERLGFLPGTLNDKIDPYLRPCTMRCTICWSLRRSLSSWRRAQLRWPRWRICAGVPSMMRSLFWTKPRTPPRSR